MALQSWIFVSLQCVLTRKWLKWLYFMYCVKECLWVEHFTRMAKKGGRYSFKHFCIWPWKNVRVYCTTVSWHRTGSWIYITLYSSLKQNYWTNGNIKRSCQPSKLQSCLRLNGNLLHSDLCPSMQSQLACIITSSKVWHKVFLPQIYIVLEAVFLKTHKCTPLAMRISLQLDWVLFCDPFLQFTIIVSSEVFPYRDCKIASWV